MFILSQITIREYNPYFVVNSLDRLINLINLINYFLFLNKLQIQYVQLYKSYNFLADPFRMTNEEKKPDIFLYSKNFFS